VKYKFYTTSEKAWAAMLESMRAARHSIYWEIHILRNDTPAYRFFDVIKEKARAGIKVKIIIDAVGSFNLNAVSRQALQKAGAEVLVFKYLLHRIHKKVLIIDERTAFLGGVNVGRNYKKWLDLNIMLHGSVVRKILKSFSRSYRLCKGRDSHLLSFYQERKILKVRRKIRAAKHRIIDHAPILKKKRALREYYKKQIMQARARVIIVTPYFIPGRWLIDSLKTACRQGVQVDVIIPQQADIGIMRWANRFFAYRLQKHGVNFYLTREMIHAKAFLVDGKEGLVGSNNIDAQSFDFNSEISLVFRRRDMINDLKRIMERWRRQAVPLRNMKNGVSWYEKPAAWLIHFFQPLL